MKSLDTTGSEELVESLDLIGQIMTNPQKSERQFRNIDQCMLQILSQVVVFVFVLESVYHQLYNPGLLIFIQLHHNLFLAVQMNGAAHDGEGGVQSVVVLIGIGWIKEPACAFDNFVINAFLLSLVIDAHVAKNTKTQLAESLMVILVQRLLSILGGQKCRELEYGFLTEEWLDSIIIKSQI